MSLLRSTLLLVSLLLPAAAQAAAGQVLFALGRVEIQRGGQAFAAARGTPVEVGDTLSTGPTGLAQVRMQDGALLSLRYGSTMTIDDYQAPAPPPPAVAPAAGAAPSAAAAGGRTALRLLRGAFRTVTGLIGRGSTDAYSVVTPVATIGIRGTDYSAAYCDGDCGTTPDGLYVGVSNGAIELSNDGGTLVLSNDQYGYVRDSTTPPGRTLEPPGVLDTPIPPDEDGEDGGEGDGTETAAGDTAPPDGAVRTESADARSLESGQPEGDYELRPGTGGSYAYAAPGLRGSNDNGVYTDDSGALNGFLDNAFVSIGTARNANTGFDAGTGLRWGRWTGGIAGAGDGSLDLTSSSLHWIYAASSSAPALRITGTANYVLVGNTNPTDTQGNIGFLGDATLFADFTNQTVASTVSVGINSEVWLGSGTGSIASGTPLFDGSYTVGVNDAVGSPVSSGTGSFHGFFTSGALGAGLGFSLLDTRGAEVSGAAAFALQPGGQ